MGAHLQPERIVDAMMPWPKDLVPNTKQGVPSIFLGFSMEGALAEKRHSVIMNGGSSHPKSKISSHHDKT